MMILPLVFIALFNYSTFALHVSVTRINGEVGGASVLRCTVNPSSLRMQFVHWINGTLDRGNTVFYDAPNGNGKTKQGPGDKFKNRNITGKFSPSGNIHELTIFRSLPEDRGRYLCEVQVTDTMNRISAGNGATNFTLVAMPEEFPVVEDQFGNVIKTSDCTDMSHVPVEYISNNRSFVCRVGGSFPYPTVKWSCYRHCNVSRDVANTYNRNGIDVMQMEKWIIVDALDENLTCSVGVPDPKSGKLKDRFLCFRIEPIIPDAARSAKGGDKCVSLGVGLVFGVLALVLFVTILMILWKRRKQTRSKGTSITTKNNTTDPNSMALLLNGENHGYECAIKSISLPGAALKRSTEDVEKIEELESENRKLKEQVQAFHKEKEEMKHTKENNDVNPRSKEDQKVQLELATYKELDDENERLKIERDRMLEENKKKNEKIKELEQENQRLNKDVKVLQQEIEAMKKNQGQILKRVQQENEALKQENKSLMKEIEGMKKKDQQNQQRIASEMSEIRQMVQYHDDALKRLNKPDGVKARNSFDDLRNVKETKAVQAEDSSNLSINEQIELPSFEGSMLQSRQIHTSGEELLSALDKDKASTCNEDLEFVKPIKAVQAEESSNVPNNEDSIPPVLENSTRLNSEMHATEEKPVLVKCIGRMDNEDLLRQPIQVEDAARRTENPYSTSMGVAEKSRGPFV